jgi:hypothetical protein
MRPFLDVRGCRCYDDTMGLDSTLASRECWREATMETQGERTMPGDRRREAEDRHIDEVKRKADEAAHVEGVGYE